jgi:CRISPR-associated endonuclease/helicase Cas3
MGVLDQELWGKWGRQGEWKYPLIAHLLDSAAAVAVLVEHRYLRTIEVVAELSALTSLEVKEIVLVSAGLHDLGKITPTFQAQLQNSADDFSSQSTYLSGANYPLEFPKLKGMAKDERVLLRRHEIASAAYLVTNLSDEPRGLAAIVAGHHGKWNMLGEHTAREYQQVQRHYEFLRGCKWGEQASMHRDEVLQALGVKGSIWNSKIDRSLVPSLTSIIVLADWFASTEESIENGRVLLGELSNPSQYIAKRKEWFKKFIDKSIGVPPIPVHNFTDTFGFSPSRPVQQELVRSMEPGLSIVTSPMGEGKTEASLGYWMLNGAGKGFLFALPTMATADSMFERTRDFIEKSGCVSHASLSHGRALLNSFYNDHENDIDVVIDSEGGGESLGRLTASSWLQGRHRPLLAPVAVGTVDQLLSGVLRHSYNFLRLHAVVDKVVILDEVHSYDPYMSALLERFLEWAGYLKIDVVLLSATLPKRRLNAYLSAYRSGSGYEKNEISPPYPGVVRSTISGEVDVVDQSEMRSGRETDIEVRYVATQSGQMESEFINLITDLSQRHPLAKIGVVVNTVGLAQSIASSITSACVLHSRFPALQKSQLINEVIGDFGKRSGPGQSILIATQIIEQSIDLDFDILITQLAPAASLLQRMGRLWRHSLELRDRKRPMGITSSIVYVVHQEPLPRNAFSFLPYSSAEIFRTWAALAHRTLIQIPSDIQNLVDAADVNLNDLLDPNSVDDLDMQQALNEAAKVLSAKDRMIATPAQLNGKKGNQKMVQFSSGGNGDEYSTRWSTGPTCELLLVSRDLPNTLHYPLPDGKSRASTRKILSYTVSVNKNAAALGARSGVTTSPFTNVLLRDLLVVDVEIAAEWLHLDARIGLSIE